MFAQSRVALVGEAGHVVPPIGAQGLNLGLRDAAWLADSLADGRAKGRDCGDPVTLARYTAARQLDVAARIWTIDILNRSLLSSLLPVHLARGLGLHALKALTPLRQLVVREGLAPSGATPRLMPQDGGAHPGEEVRAGARRRGEGTRVSAQASARQIRLNVSEHPPASTRREPDRAR